MRSSAFFVSWHHHLIHSCTEQGEGELVESGEKQATDGWYAYNFLFLLHFLVVAVTGGFVAVQKWLNLAELPLPLLLLGWKGCAWF